MTYNGYTNYQTWSVALWLDNEEHTSDLLNTLANLDLPIHHRALELRETVEDMMPNLEPSMWSDIILAAMQEVNWVEIIKSHIEEE